MAAADGRPSQVNGRRIAAYSRAPASLTLEHSPEGIAWRESFVKTIAVLFALVAAMLPGPASAEGLDISTYNKLDSAAKKFVLIAAKGHDPRQQNEFANMVREQLRARGWKETEFKAADVAVFVQYQASAGSKSSQHDSTTPDGADRQGDMASPRGTVAGAVPVAYTHASTSIEPVHTAAASGPTYERTLRIEMFEVKAFMRNMQMVPVFDTTVRSSGSSGAGESAVPELMKAAFEEFPGSPGTTRRTAGPPQ